MKGTKRSFRFVMVALLVFSLTFPLTFNAYAVTDGTVETTSDSGTNFVQGTEGQTDPGTTSPGPVETSPEALETTLPAVTADDPEVPEFAGNLDDLPDSIKKAIEEMGSMRSLAASEDPILRIDSVEVVNGGKEQARNRNYVTYDDGYDAYVTSKRNASMTDARVFHVFAVFNAGELDMDYSKFDIKKVDFTYGGKTLDQWVQYSKIFDEEGYVDDEGWFGDPAISVLNQVHYTDGKILVVTAAIQFDEFFEEDWYSLNIPYDGFTADKKEAFKRIISEPDLLGPHDLNMRYDKNSIASTSVELNLYDSFHTWKEINDYASELKGLPDENSEINGRYVSVESLTKSETGLDVWNVVIADSEEAVNDYLGTTKPKMETDPAGLAAIIEDEESSDDEVSAAEEEADTEYSKIPIYFNNVHPDETPASDAIMELINSFIYEEELSFDTQTDAVPHERTPGDYDGYTSQGPENLTVKKTFDVEDVLDKFILVFNITENPEGKNKLVRVNNYGFDLNRDAAYQTQKESTALTSDLVKWDPLTMLEYHGYVDGLLIEPCTGPHDPNYEYDLFAEKMLEQGNTLGKAMIGNTAYTRYLVPATDYSDGWDDGAPVYGPMFAMLYGTMGYTLEIPYSTEDSKEACYSAGLAMVNDCLENRAEYYLNKLEIKARGKENKDDPRVDKYLTDPYTGAEVGRPRIAEGINFFPDYYVIPVDEVNQRNPLEAYKALEFLARNGAEISKITTDSVTLDEKVLKKDSTYVLDMRQANRSFVNSMLSDGYDASSFLDIYAEIVISYPDMRNFDCLTVRSAGFFDGNTALITDPETEIVRPATSIEGDSERVVIQNDNIDAIRLVNRILDDGETVVEMLTADYRDYKKGDFIISRAALDEFGDGLLVFGSAFVQYDARAMEASVEGAETITLVDPDIKIVGSESHSRYIMDLLGFKGDYAYATKLSEISKDTDVLVGFNTGSDVSALVSGSGIGFIGIGTSTMNAAETNNLLPGLDCFIPKSRTTETYREGLMRSYYSDSSLITANYDRTTAAYVMNGTYITRAPFDGESLITLATGTDFFKAGWYPGHDALKGEMLAVSGFSGSDHDVPVTLFANNIFSKAHAQHTFNMFANAVFLTAADYGTDKPLIEASPSSQETLTPSVEVKLEYAATRRTNEVMADADSDMVKKYKVTSSEAEKSYDGGDSWLDYTSTSAIKLETAGTFYIHAYAENTLGENVQRVFGPYNIGTSGGSGGHSGSHGGGGSAPVITPPAVTAPAISFTDIDGHWAKASIEYVVGKKLFSGLSSTLFGPDETMTRGMLVTVLGRAYGLDTAPYSAKSVFTDVPSTAYYAPYVAWAYEKKIVSGMGDGLFAPDKPVTRGEMAAIITNYMKFIGKGAGSTADLTYADLAEIDGWGLEGVKFVTANGLMTGTSGNNFDFDRLSTRAQVATVLERLLKLN